MGAGVFSFFYGNFRKSTAEAASETSLRAGQQASESERNCQPVPGGSRLPNCTTPTVTGMGA